MAVRVAVLTAVFVTFLPKESFERLLLPVTVLATYVPKAAVTLVMMALRILPKKDFFQLLFELLFDSFEVEDFSLPFTSCSSSSQEGWDEASSNTSKALSRSMTLSYLPKMREDLII